MSKYLIIIMLLSLVLLPLALAAVEVDNNDMTISVDYGNLENREDTIDIRQAVTLTNSGNTTEQVTLSWNNLQTDYQLTVSPSTFQLAPGTQDVIIEGTIPVDQKVGLNDIGSLRIVTSSGQDQYFILKTDVAPILELDRIYVYVNGNEEERINNNDDTVNNLKPGDNVELRFLVKNLFDNNYDDGDIDGTINLQLDDSDFGDDIDEDIDFTVDAGDETNAEEVSYNFTIPNDAEEGTYTIEIFLDADSNSDASMELNWNLNLEVEKERDDVRIDSLTISPAEVSCNRKIQIDTKLSNYGTDNQNHMVLVLGSNTLNLNQRYEFTLDRSGDNDDSISKQYVMDIPANAVLGDHLITATAYYDYTITADRLTAEVLVKECKPTTTTPKTNTTTSTSTTTNNNQPPASPAPTQISNLPPSGTMVQTIESSSYKTDDYLIAAILVGIVLLVALVILMAVLIIKKK